MRVERQGGGRPPPERRQDRDSSQLSSRLGLWKPGEIPPSQEEERAKTGPQRKTPLFQLGPWDSPLSHYLFLILRPPANFNWLPVKAIKDFFFLLGRCVLGWYEDSSLTGSYHIQIDLFQLHNLYSLIIK